MTDQSANETSVKKFTPDQLAQTFISLAKDPKICRVVIPDIQKDIQKFPQELMQIATWRFDPKYSTVGGIGDIRSAIINIIIFTRKYRPTIVSNTYAAPSNTKLIAEVDLRIESIRDRIVSDGESEDLENEIKTMEAVKLKLINEKIEHIDNSKATLTNPQMIAIAKRVFELLKDNEQNARFYEALRFYSEPKVDKIKERAGGDYVLKNTTRERRYTSSDAWHRDSKAELNSDNISDRRNGDIYEPASSSSERTTQNNNWRGSTQSSSSTQSGSSTQSSSSTKSSSGIRYISPAFSVDNTYSNDSDKLRGVERPKTSRYAPPIAEKGYSYGKSNSFEARRSDASSEQNQYRPAHLSQSSRSSGYSNRDYSYRDHGINDTRRDNRKSDGDFVNINDIKRATDIESFADFPSLEASNKNVSDKNASQTRSKSNNVSEIKKTNNNDQSVANRYTVLLSDSIEESNYVDSWDNLDNSTESSNTKAEKKPKQSSFADIARLAKERELKKNEIAMLELREKGKKDAELSKQTRRESINNPVRKIMLSRSTTKILTTPNVKISSTDSWDINEVVLNQKVEEPTYEEDSSIYFPVVSEKVSEEVWEEDTEYDNWA